MLACFRFFQFSLVLLCLFIGVLPIAAANAISSTGSASKLYYTEQGAVVVDGAISVSGDNLAGAYAIITGGLVTAQDRLSLGYVAAGVNWSYNASTGYLTITGTASAAEYQAMLRSVTYQNISGSPTYQSRTIRFVLGNKAPFMHPDGKPHFYERSVNTYKWEPALQAAATFRYLGLTGYLVTVTSASEQEFMFSQAGGSRSWLGGSDVYTFDQENTWYWLSGPEYGQTFWSGRSNGSVQNGYYANWNSGEPNNDNNEDFTEMYDTGKWNDRDPNDIFLYAIVEYGNMGGDPVIHLDRVMRVDQSVVIDGSVSSRIYQSGGIGNAIYVDRGFRVSGNGPISQVVVEISNYKSGDVLSVESRNGITAVYNGSGRLTLSGLATSGSYQDILRRIKYYNTNASNPDMTQRTITYTATYGYYGGTVGESIGVSLQSLPYLWKDGTSSAVYYEGSSSSYVVDGSLVVTGPNLQGAYVKIVSGFVPGQDELIVTNMNGLSGSYNGSTGVLTITGSGTAAQYQAMLRTVSYRNSSGSPSYGNREIRFVLGHLLPNFGNGHMYEYVTVSGTQPTWGEALLLGPERSYLGYQGYLATVTDSTETSYLDSMGVGGAGFLGGSDSVVEGTWRWLSGPEGLENSESGRLFYHGGTVQAPDYYVNWSSGEPNNFGTGQDRLQRYPTGFWDDIDDTTRLNYFVEYGGMPGDLATMVSKTIRYANITSVSQSVTDNVYITGVGLETVGETIVVDRGLVVSGAVVTGATVRLTTVKSGDILGVTNGSGISGSYDSVTGILTLSGSADAASYQSVLRTLTYRSSSTGPDMSDRTLIYTLTYGVNGEAATGSMVIRMSQPVVLGGSVTSQVYFSDEDQWMTVDGGAVVSGGDLAHFRFDVPVGAALNYSGGSLGTSYSNGLLMLSGSGSAGTYQGVVRGVQVKPNSVGSNFNVRMTVGQLQKPDGDTFTETYPYATVGSDVTAAQSKATSKGYYGWRGGVRTLNSGAKTVLVEYSPASGTYGGPTELTHTVLFERYVSPEIFLNVTSNVVIVDPELLVAPAGIVVDPRISVSGGANQDAPLRGASVSIVGGFQSGQDSLSATAFGGLGVTYDAGTGILTVSGTGTVATYEAVLRTVMYNNSASSPNSGTRTVRYSVYYGGTNLPTRTKTVDIAVQFVVPNRLTKDGVSTRNYYVESPAIVVDGSVSVSGPTLSGAYVKITDGFVSGEDVLGYPSGIGSLSGSYNSGTGLLTVSGVGTSSEYQDFLRGVTYRNTASTPSSYADRKIVYVLGHELPDFETGHVYRVNQSSGSWYDVKGRSEATTYLGRRGYLATVTSSTENAKLGTLGATGNVYLGGSDDAVEGVWRWVSGPEGLENGGVGRQFWSGAQFGSVTAPDRYADFESGEPNNSGLVQHYVQRQVSNGKWVDVGQSVSSNFVVEYGGYSGEAGILVSKKMEVRARPVIQMSTTYNTYVKATGPIAMDGRLVVAGYEIVSGSVTIENGFESGVDTLDATELHGITKSYNSATGVLTLSGLATSQAYEEVMRTVRYGNSSASPTEGIRGIRYRLWFGDNPYFMTSGNMTVYVSPIYSMGVGSVVTANYFSGRGALGVASGVRVSGGTLSSAMVRIVSNYRSTEDRLSATPAYGISVSYDVPTGVLMLSGSGSASEYETVLNSVTYENIAQTPSPLTKQIQYVLGSKEPASHNLHFYEKEESVLTGIPQAWTSTTREHRYVVPSAIDWDLAVFLASRRAYLGWKGYLATVTGVSESQYVGSLLSGEAWLGATDRVSQGNWRWVTGPEGLENGGAGRLFSNGSTGLDGYFTNWSSGQPSGGSGEDYMHMVYNPALGGQYQWTDLGSTGVGPVYLPRQYVREYGGFSGDNTFWFQVPVKVFGSNHTLFFGTMF